MNRNYKMNYDTFKNNFHIFCNSFEINNLNKKADKIAVGDRSLDLVICDVRYILKVCLALNTRVYTNAGISLLRKSWLDTIAAIAAHCCTGFYQDTCT